MFILPRSHLYVNIFFGFFSAEYRVLSYIISIFSRKIETIPHIVYVIIFISNPCQTILYKISAGKNCDGPRPLFAEVFPLLPYKKFLHFAGLCDIMSHGQSASSRAVSQKTFIYIMEGGGL